MLHSSKISWFPSCSGLSDRRKQQYQVSDTFNQAHMHAMRRVLTNVAVWTESCRDNIATGVDFLFFMMICNTTIRSLKPVASSGWRIVEGWDRKHVDEGCRVLMFTGGLSKTTTNLRLTGCDSEPWTSQMLSRSSNHLTGSFGAAGVEELPFQFYWITSDSTKKIYAGRLLIVVSIDLMFRHSRIIGVIESSLNFLMYKYCTGSSFCECGLLRKGRTRQVGPIP
jgi:hypothetical protein